jgi:hypothetical protein
MGRQNRLCLRFSTSGRGEDIRKGFRRVNMMEILCIINENGKMRLVENIPEMGEVP